MNVYLRTFGCQMNFLESELVRDSLSRAGMSLVDDTQEADVGIVNGCVVREHAEARAWEQIGVLRAEGVPVVGVIGCLARRYHGVDQADFAVSPEHYDVLPDVLKRAGQSHSIVISYDGPGLAAARRRGGAVVAWVAISQGCDNFCSYCVVPYARGREVSRPPGEIIEEIGRLADGPCREVVLIGQNVNSYRHGLVEFPDLLARLDALRFVPRLRFMTSHPRDMGPATLEVMAGSEAICHHLHLPLQAGSDRVLRRMNRGYSAAEYVALVGHARTLMPEMGLTTDLMAGFPGESAADFSRTLSLVRDLEFDAAFTFGYSPRPGTAALNMSDHLPREVVGKRLRTLIEVVRACAARRLRRRIGSIVEVLVERASPKDCAEYMGRSGEGNVVVMPRAGVVPGDMVPVRISELRGFTLAGAPVAEEVQAQSGRRISEGRDGRSTPEQSRRYA